MAVTTVKSIPALGPIYAKAVLPGKGGGCLLYTSDAADDCSIV